MDIVTGGEGFIGSHIVARTGALSYDIKSGLDILDVETLDKYLSGVNTVFHCAAKISVPEGEEKPELYYQNNVVGTQNVANTDVEKIIFFSSAAIYGEHDRKIVESDELRPMSNYAQNKIDGENILKESSIPTVVLRPFNLYGPRQSEEYAGVITIFINNALQGEDLLINGDGGHVRDFVYVDDVLNAAVSVSEKDLGDFEVFNLGSGTTLTMLELAEKIINLTNSSSKIVFREERTGDIRYSCADATKANEILGWKPTVSLDQGLCSTIEYIKSD